MLSGKEMMIVYEMVPVMPGINDPLKITMNISRKLALLMAKMIEIGMQNREDQPGLFSIVDDATMEQLKKLPEDILERAELTKWNEKLIALATK